jgi:hypothetical protein
MAKVEIEIPQGQYELLCEIAQKVGVPVEKLIQQETDEALNNACVWAERAQL